MEETEFKIVCIKNRACYYFNDMIKLEDFDIGNILMDGKPNQHILIYGISYKTLIGAKPLRSRFNKVDGFIRIYDGARFSIFLGSEKYDKISYKSKQYHVSFF